MKSNFEAILEDPERAFVASAFFQLEVLPQAIFNGRQAEVEVAGSFQANLDARPKNEAVGHPLVETGEPGYSLCPSPSGYQPRTRNSWARLPSSARASPAAPCGCP